MGRQPETSIEVKRLVLAEVLDGRGPTEILHYLRNLERQDPLKLGRSGRAPSLSTVKRLVKQYKPNDPSGQWMFLRASDDQRRYVPDVLSHVYYKTQGRVWLTNDMAERVTQVRKSCPGITLDWAYNYASMFQIADNDPGSEWLVILTLGSRPWEAGEKAQDLVDHLTEMAIAFESGEQFVEEEKKPDLSPSAKRAAEDALVARFQKFLDAEQQSSASTWEM